MRQPLPLFLGLLLVALLAPSPAAAEARKISGTARVTAVLSQTMLPVGDQPDHEVGVVRDVEADTSDDPGFSLSYDVVEIVDYVAGSGAHHGYRVSTGAGPNHLSSAYEGTTKVVTRPGAPPDVTFEGKWWFTGGTGTFQGITGGGTYKGQATPTGVTWQWQGEYEIKK